MAGIPPTLDSDAEDVVWALQTADALWKRAERVDAIVWLRRAAQAAGEAQQDDRALQLARGAAELTDLIAGETATITSSAAPPMSHAPTTGVDDLLGHSDVDIVIDSADLQSAPPSGQPPAPQMQVSTAPMAFMPTRLPAIPPPAAPEPPPAPPPPPPLQEPMRPPAISAPPPLPTPPLIATAPVTTTERPSSEVQPLVLSSVSSTPPAEVRTAAETHAGMLDPWANAEPPPLPRHSPSVPQISESIDDDDEVVTSVKELQSSAKRAASAPPSPPKPPPVPTPKASERAPQTEPAISFEPSLPIVQAFVPPVEEVVPARVAVPPPEPTLVSAGQTPAASRLADEAKTDPKAVVIEEPKPIEAPKPPAAKPVEAPKPSPAVEAPKPVEAPKKVEAAAPAPKLEVSAVKPVEEPKPAAEESKPPIDTTPNAQTQSVLSPAEVEAIEAFADLPDDARQDLATAATVHSLVKDEEVTGFSLAIVIEGEVDVAAVIVDIPAERLGKGRVLKPTGSLRESVPLRLICASSNARVATWEAKDIEATFKACPWVEDDLRAHADRVLALVGVTMGPLADRLDESIRTQITSRLTVREIPEGDELVAKGAAVRELVIVGQGVIELMNDGVAVGSVGTGEIVFGSEVVSGGKASATARAGKGGALVLAVDRGVAQELMSTLPPLLELLVGM
jgi:hypothetical protein